jgi:hypothetical protein
MCIFASLVHSALGVEPKPAQPKATKQKATDTYAKQVAPLLKKYCYDCHGNGEREGSVSFDGFTRLDDHVANHALWSKAWKNLHAGLMPPRDQPQPTDGERQAILSWIEHSAFRYDAAHPDPGRVTLRRLNREEYRWTIYDLLGIDFNVVEQLPPDDTGYGFDTIGDVLSLSPILMEKYLDAAAKVAELAITKSRENLRSNSIDPKKFAVQGNQKRNATRLPIPTFGAAEYLYTNSSDGMHNIVMTVHAAGDKPASNRRVNVMLVIDEVEVAKAKLDWDQSRDATLVVTQRLPKGKVKLGLLLSGQDKADDEGLSVEMKKMKVEGPLAGGSKAVLPPRCVELIEATPSDPTKKKELLTAALRDLATRALRKPVDEGTLKRLVTLAETGEQRPGGALNQGLEDAVTVLLASPRFLFRAETQPQPDDPAHVVPLDDYALASRLSYFLWSSMPDAALLEAARTQSLRSNLRAQIDRMLDDPKSERFVRNFVGQWLQTRDIATNNVNASKVLGINNTEADKIYSRSARSAIGPETEAMFAHILQNDRPATELLNADYTFLNEALAKFYGIEGVSGSNMRKVDLDPETHRGGLLTHASFLVVTSNPTRTSPVKRGLFVLDNILGMAPPPPPPDIPALEDAKKDSKRTLTMRETLEIHRANPLCSSCHARMDPIGLGLENFNALGMWRDQEAKKPIDTVGELVTGEKFNNVAELSEILATSRRMDFYRCLCEKLFTFALGRGPEYYDLPMLEKMAERLEQNDGKLKTLIYDIIESAPFVMRRGDHGAVASTVTGKGETQ